MGVYAYKELEKESQARATQGTPNTRHPSALPRYATLPRGPNSDSPEMGRILGVGEDARGWGASPFLSHPSLVTLSSAPGAEARAQQETDADPPAWGGSCHCGRSWGWG